MIKDFKDEAVKEKDEKCLMTLECALEKYLIRIELFSLFFINI